MRERVNVNLIQLNKNTLYSTGRRVTVFLALFVVLGVFWCLKLTGITMAGEAFCGMAEHQHGENCPTARLICDQKESPGHMHDESCILRQLVCEQDEVSAHIHDDSCLLRELICTETEQEGHTHDDSCRSLELVCTEEEQEGHTHSDDCFTQSLVCDIADDPEHTHGSECYEESLTCDLQETEGHMHDDGCYAPGEDFICGQEETAGHTHSDDCYIVHEDTFVCGLEETEGHSHAEECFHVGIGFGCGMTEAEGHIHTEECLTDETELGCGKVCTEGHTHTEECYEYLAECPLEEHIHVASCYSNITAELESEADWQHSLSGVTEEFSTAETLVSVARSQLGYAESTRNFEVDLQGVRRGITRYGQWYGNPYGDWSAMFVSFCLHYAGAEDLPVNAGPESMRLEWEEAGLYQPVDGGSPQVGNLIFLRPDVAAAEYYAPDDESYSEADAESSAESDGEFESDSESSAASEPDVESDGEESAPDSIYSGTADAAGAVAIITEVTADSITVIQGDVDDAVAERIISINDPAILGYGLVPESSPYALTMAPRAGELTFLGRTVDYPCSLTADNRSFVIYARYGEEYYALVSQPAGGIEYRVAGVPIRIDADGSIYTDVADPDSLLWNFTASGNNYYIRNAATGRYLHPGGENGIIYGSNWPTALRNQDSGAQFIHTGNNDVGIFFDTGEKTFSATTKSNATTLYLGVAERCTVWLDGSNGGLSSLGGSQNQSYSIAASSQMTLPMQWLSPTRYSYRLRGWYDVTHNQYYAPGEKVTITEDTVFYADWMADTYDIGQYNAYVANTVSTNSFITTQLFDYNYLFNILSADPAGSISATNHSETWSIVSDENVEYADRESLNFIFLDYGNSGTLDYPNNRQNGVNQYPGDGIVTGGIYNDAIGDALFATDDRLPGKVYLGTGDHLFQIMDDANDPYYGYYYYDSARNAASYNQSDERFYVYDYLEATSAEISAAKSDFLPLNSPYANTNGQQPGTYEADDEHADMTNYLYDAKFSDSDDRVVTNYAFGMKIDIRFYLPNKPGEGGNQDLYGNDMRFMFSGDDDLWVLVDGELALDIGGIHQAETGEINFSTGEVLVQDEYNDALSAVVSGLDAGEHTLTVMYLERGASHSNCAIYFNLAPRFRLAIQKEDVLSRDYLNGAQFSVFRDRECTIPAELWESQESYLRGDPATNTFTVANGVANMWGMGAGNTYYICETQHPDNEDYDLPKGIIRMTLDKKGAATYSVEVMDVGDGISGGFTVHGFRVDEETQQANIVATNAPKWVQEVTSVEARKVWDDAVDHSARPVTVYLTIRDPDGTVRRLQEAQLSAETDWQHLWENLPKYYEDGTAINYGVEEAYVSGYYSKVEQVDTYSYTGSQWTATTSLEDGKTYLLKTDSGFLSTKDLGSDTGYMWVDEATAGQSVLAQWNVTKGSGGYKLTNKANQTITFYYKGGSPTDFYASTGGESNAAKQYFAYSVSGGKIRLYYDGSNNRDYYLSSSMTSAQKFNYSRNPSEALLFTPMTLTQSSVSKPKEGELAYQITNTPLKTETSLTVNKQWRIDIGDDPSLYEKAQVTVKLLANGKDTGRTVTLNLKNGWSDVFRGLPYQDDDGTLISYTVEESWSSKDWLVEYGPINASGGTVPVYDTTVTNVYRWGHGVELPSTGSPARLLFILGGNSIMLFSLVSYGFVSRRKRERRME